MIFSISSLSPPISLLSFPPSFPFLLFPSPSPPLSFQFAQFTLLTQVCSYHYTQSSV